MKSKKVMPVVGPIQLEDGRDWHPVLMRGVVSALSERIPLSKEHLETLYARDGKRPGTRAVIRSMRDLHRATKDSQEYWESRARRMESENSRLRDALKVILEFAASEDEA